MDFKLIKTILMLIVASFVAITVVVGFIAIFTKQIKQLIQTTKLKKSSKKISSNNFNENFIEVSIDEYEEFLEFKKFKNSK